MVLWVALAAVIVYAAGLFWLAVRGDRRNFSLTARQTSWVYGLSLAVYCTSWTFYGAVGTAVSSGWTYLPIYLGPIILFTVGYRVVGRTLRLSKAHHSTSIADFLSTRYGKSRSVAALVTLIATVGVVPYMALQLKSVGETLFALSPAMASRANVDDIALAVAGTMALFAVLFGTRQVDLTQHNRGLVLTIAVEGIVKLLVLLLVAGVACLLLADAGRLPALQTRPFSDVFSADQLDARFFMLTLVSACAALCLPRQFHMTIVEAQTARPDGLMRNLFPGYLVLTSLAVLPITMAGVTFLPAGDMQADMIMLALPMAMGADSLAVLAFLGGFSAATGMVIVTSVALSGMITNDLIVPALYSLRRGGARQPMPLAHSLLWIRRGTVFALLLLAYLYYRGIDSSSTLAGLGTLSFAAVAQFAPGLIGGMAWKDGNRHGMLAGLVAGFGAWLFLMMIPAYTGQAPPFAVAQDSLVSGVLISLTLNCLAYILVSASTRPDLTDRAQASAFVTLGVSPESVNRMAVRLHVADIRLLLKQFVGEERSRSVIAAVRKETGRAYADIDAADLPLVEAAERLLSGVLGGASARALISSTLEGDPVPLEQVVAMLDETSQRLQFSGELLQTAIENIDQGVAVVDGDMRLVAWNSRYVEMFALPGELVTVGRPIADLIAFNLERMGRPAAEVGEEVSKRLEHMRAGRRHGLEREQSDGRVLRILGNPTPAGGYVTSYTDITADRRAEQALEAEVAERTRQLTEVNMALELATRSKTRFLAAASHDLMQPLNAARLFTSALDEEISAGHPRARQLTRDIDRSIEMADRLLRALLDISKLDAGGLQPRLAVFALASLIDDLRAEFTGMAQQRGLTLDLPSTDLWVRTDRNLLFSIMQNLMTNAVRYTRQGRVWLTLEQDGGTVSLHVCDTGIGIAQADQELIFEEFRQIGRGGKREGVGLGLSISRRLAKLLGTDITVRSVVGEGSIFALAVEAAQPRVRAEGAASATASGTTLMAGRTVLCIDNDPTVIEALSALLGRWGCQVLTAAGRAEALAASPQPPDLVIFDYQLDEGDTGDKLFAALVDHWGQRPPGILITAEDSPHTKQVSVDAAVQRLLKPVAPATLRALVSQLLREGGLP